MTAERMPIGSRVMCRKDVGVIVGTFARGWAYRVEFPGLGRVICMANVLTRAPENIVPFRRALLQEDKTA